MTNPKAIKRISLSASRLSKRIVVRTVALLSVSLAAAMPVYGHEINIKMDEIGSIRPRLVDNLTYTTIFTGADLSNMGGDSDSIAIKIPVFYSSDICQKDHHPFLKIFDDNDASEFRLNQNFEGRSRSASRGFSLGKKEIPVVDHVQRSHNALTTIYPILDPIQKEVCSKVNNGEYDSGSYTITIFINSYNTFLQLVRDGIPIHDVFISPVNFGSGDSIMNLIKNRSMHVTFDIKTYKRNLSQPRRIKVYSFKWSELLHDLNLNYGSKSIPVLSPVVNMGNGAAAAILISTN
ncbi:hypothetical protein [Sphingopyxis granuli]|uniref:hypothetical protein n=1 Tax=Sphingopyxis granuli TaxID=267128 RepID=UPI001BB05FD3|nr:hypothetical protein [Sphingopyxis granuli]QUM73200.1 hypothetical protein ICN83_04695 [Sphingopyxis granuli]